ncbi:60S ribosome subunit biogenesis protein NIP7 like protein [Habropoda laboriosa]|uniref:60S ribosome subunit biogenesis protein NIP7 like protein n=1 Tax=Habropoda laboriosa TaxID=597456 RepID=A0A0L7R0E1_9HYME|nr:60S ribosome subunit biogenesis protein NIP7 like protein [Habropoda laboriosa]
MVTPDRLTSVGTCFGKFTKSGKFKLQITALYHVAPYAQYKIWLKPSAEQQFLYGNHISKSSLSRITENTPQYQGVVIFSTNDIPLVIKILALHFYTKINIQL